MPDILGVHAQGTGGFCGGFLGEVGGKGEEEEGEEEEGKGEGEGGGAEGEGAGGVEVEHGGESAVGG